MPQPKTDRNNTKKKQRPQRQDTSRDKEDHAARTQHYLQDEGDGIPFASIGFRAPRDGNMVRRGDISRSVIGQWQAGSGSTTLVGHEYGGSMQADFSSQSEHTALQRMPYGYSPGFDQSTSTSRRQARHYQPSPSSPRQQASDNVDKDRRSDDYFLLNQAIVSGQGAQFSGYRYPSNGNADWYIGAAAHQYRRTCLHNRLHGECSVSGCEHNLYS